MLSSCCRSKIEEYKGFLDYLTKEDKKAFGIQSEVDQQPSDQEGEIVR